MTIVLSKEGDVSLPKAIREQLHLSPGEDFEISVEDGDTIILRRVNRPANRGLVDHLLACPFPFEISERERDDTAPVTL